MRKIGIIAFSVAVLLTACKKSDIKEINAIVQKGTWKVTKFIEDGNDKTSDFNDYSFFFKSKTEVDASHNGMTHAGTWKTFKDDNVYKFELSFSNAALLDEISDDWDIMLFTDKKIELKDVSGDGSVDYLTLERN
jgi:hypothetical protein